MLLRRIAAGAIPALAAAAGNCGNHVCAAGYERRMSPAAICCDDAACPAVPCSDSLCCVLLSCAGAAADFAAAGAVALSDLAACDTVAEPACATTCLPGYAAASAPQVKCAAALQYQISPTCAAVTCAANQRVAANACVPCPSGTTSLAGASAAGGDTQCSGISCSTPWTAHAAAHVLPIASAAPCAAVGAQGCALACDVAAGYNATAAPLLTCVEVATGVAGWQVVPPCVAVLCPADHRVQGNACVACPEGQSRPAGDDATQGNTACSPNACAPSPAFDAASLPGAALSAAPTSLTTGAVLATSGPAPVLTPKAGYWCTGAAVALCPSPSSPTFSVSGYTCSEVRCPAPLPPAVLAQLQGANAEAPAAVAQCDTGQEAPCALSCAAGYIPGAGGAPQLSCGDDPPDGNGDWAVLNPCAHPTCSAPFDPAANNVLSAPAAPAACDSAAKPPCALACAAGYFGAPSLTCSPAGNWTVVSPCAAMCTVNGTRLTGIPDGFAQGAGVPTGLASPAETNCAPGSGFLLRRDATMTACDTPTGSAADPRADCPLGRCCLATCGFMVCPAGYQLRDAPNTIRCTSSDPGSCTAALCCRERTCDPQAAPSLGGAVVNCSGATAHGSSCSLQAVAGYACEGAVSCTAASSDSAGYQVAAACGVACDSFDPAAGCAAAPCANLNASWAGQRIYAAAGFPAGVGASAASLAGARVGSAQGAALGTAVCARGYAVSPLAAWACAAAGGRANATGQLCAPARCDLASAAAPGACGAGPCRGVAAEWSAGAVWRAGAFLTAAMAHPALAGSRAGGSGGTVLGGPVCAPGWEPELGAGLLCGASGGVAAFDRQLCSPLRCAELDLASACAGRTCANLGAGFAGRRVSRAGSFAHAAPVTQQAFEGAADAASGAPLPGAVCAPGYAVSAAAVVACLAAAGLATLSAQLCAESPSSGATPAPGAGSPAPPGARCPTLDLAAPAACGGAPCGGLAPAWSARRLYAEGGWAHGGPVHPAALRAARSVPDGAAMSSAGAPCAGDGVTAAQNASVRLLCSAADAALNGQLCAALRPDSEAVGAPSAEALLRRWAAPPAGAPTAVGGAAVLPGSARCAAHASTPDWLSCSLALAGSVAALPPGFREELRWAAASALLVAPGRVRNIALRDGSVLAAFDVATATSPAPAPAALPPGAAPAAAADEDDTVGWWVWALVGAAVLALCVVTVVMLARRSPGGEAGAGRDEPTPYVLGPSEPSLMMQSLRAPDPSPSPPPPSAAPAPHFPRLPIAHGYPRPHVHGTAAWRGSPPRGGAAAYSLSRPAFSSR